MNKPTPSQEVELIEISIEEAKDKVALAEAIRRLCKNKDFKKVFLDHFLGSEVARTVKLMADPAAQDAARQESLQKMLIAVGQVDQFIRTTLTMGDLAAQGIADDEDELENLLAEGGE